MSADRMISFRIEDTALDYWTERAATEGTTVSELLRQAATQVLNRPIIHLPANVRCSEFTAIDARAYVQYPGTFQFDKPWERTKSPKRRRFWRRVREVQ